MTSRRLMTGESRASPWVTKSSCCRLALPWLPPIVSVFAEAEVVTGACRLGNHAVVSVLMQHVRKHHSAVSMTSNLDDGTEGGDLPGCVGTTQDKRDAEELEMVTGDRSTEDCDLALSDFAFNLCQRFAAVRSREDLAIVYGRMAGEGMGEVWCLVAAHILGRPATAFPAARSFAYIEELALDAVRDQVAVLAAELGITVVNHAITLEGLLGNATAASVSAISTL